jgi:protein-S-isoprenylcysteine O-methyltransferase Ste14
VTYNPKDHRVERPTRRQSAYFVSGLVAVLALIALFEGWSHDLAAMNWGRLVLGVVLFVAGITAATLWGVATGTRRDEFEAKEATIAAQREQLAKADRDIRRLHSQVDDAFGDPARESAA